MDQFEFTDRQGVKHTAKNGVTGVPTTEKECDELRSQVAALTQQLAEVRLDLRVAISGLKELEAMYFDFAKTTYDLVEIRAIISTTLRQLGAAKRIRSRESEVTT